MFYIQKGAASIEAPSTAYPAERIRNTENVT